MSEDRKEPISGSLLAPVATEGRSREHDGSRTLAGGPADSRNACKLRRLRLIVIGLCLWFMFVIITPDLLLGVLRIDVPAVHATLDTLSVCALGAGIIYLMVQISYLTTVIRPVLWGICFLAVSEAYRILGLLHVWNRILDGWWHNALARLFEDAFTGIGLVLTVGGLLYAVVELLRIRHRLEDEHTALVEETLQRRRTQQALFEQQAKAAHTARLSSLGEMASGLAHEINNPLAIISVASQQLVCHAQDGALDPSRISVLIDNISRNVRRIEDIIRGLRNLSRDGSGDSFVVVPVNTVLDETLEVCRARFTDKGIRLDVIIASDRICIECRPSQIAQVLLNLLNNAFDAVMSVPEKWVKLELSHTDGWVEIGVTDGGSGLAEETAGRIMEPFFTTKKAGRGMGLGLSVSKAIAEAHHGDLFYDPSGAHTRFVLKLPVRQPVSPAATRKNAINH